MAHQNSTTDIKKLYILLCGYEILPKSVSVAGADPRLMLCEPICAYLLETHHGWVLLDAGLDPANIEDLAKKKKYFTSLNMTPPIIRPAHNLENQLAALGIRKEDIAWVILSHLHFDHCGYIKYLKNARISVQRKEYTAALSSSCPGYIQEDFNSDDIQWDFQDGDWQAFPGLNLITTFGHTPGHQSAVVTLPHSGPMILSFDTGDLQENFTALRIPGSTTNAQDALLSIKRLNDLKTQLDAELVLFHDPQAIEKLKIFPHYYD